MVLNTLRKFKSHQDKEGHLPEGLREPESKTSASVRFGDNPAARNEQQALRKKLKTGTCHVPQLCDSVHTRSSEYFSASYQVPIYGMKDKWGAETIYLSVIPDDRNADVIDHVFLDFVETYGAIPQQITIDKGSETGNIYDFTTGSKTAYAPGIDLARYPACVSLKSTNNTPIESLWHWFQDQHLFNWIWPPIVHARREREKLEAGFTLEEIE
ncbi:hypothetical protein B0H14DRAFT_3649111 [Mycena olivaceomarginata]|nr:hypothetical protein B0H14DRAFT_3649111 [Mycena olivaceomarginata]